MLLSPAVYHSMFSDAGFSTKAIMQVTLLRSSWFCTNC